MTDLIAVLFIRVSAIITRMNKWQCPNVAGLWLAGFLYEMWYASL